MKAYLIVTKKILLKEDFLNNKFTKFLLPKEILSTNGVYQVEAIDSHGNNLITNIYVLEGIFSTKPFID